MTQPLAESALAPPSQEPSDEGALEAKAEKKKNKSRRKAERRRAVQTMFRIAYQNHIALSQIADQKFGMLINVNGLIMSVVLALLAPRLVSWSWMYAPGAALALGSLVSLAFAVLGSRPRFERTPITVDDVRNNRGNVLFFGHYTSLSIDDFQAAIRELGKDQGLVADALARQLYSMGDPLAKKYRYLHFAYTAFLVGVLAAGGLFVVALVAST